MSPIDRTNAQTSPTRGTLEERLEEAGRRSLPGYLIQLAQEFQDRCLQRYAEHYPQRFSSYFSADISQIENPIWKFAVSPFIAGWAALRTFYDAAGIQRAFIESQYDPAPFHLLYINTELLSPLGNCPRTIPNPLTVTKGGSSDHRDVISEVRERLVAHLGIDPLSALVGQVQLNGDQVFTALFDVLTTQLKGRMWPEQYPLYQAELARYIAPQLEGGGGIWYMYELFYVGYKWVLDFKEEIDIPEGEEPPGETQFQSIRETAQGPFASTCGVYAVLSLFESY